MSVLLSIMLALLSLSFSAAQLHSRQGCNGSYQICSPTGAIIAALPPVGPELGTLYTDLVQSINTENSADVIDSRFSKPVKRQNESPFCCAQTSTCLILVTFKVPFCWDQFTTDYYFPDGSYGSIVTGNFTSPAGIKVDLIYGNYQNINGTTENIYTATPTMMPNTESLSMPTPWTSNGIGSAIPGSSLGSNATITASISEIPSTTITAITLPSSTISIGTSICHACNFTIVPGPTGPFSVASATTPEASVTTSFSNTTAPPGTGSIVGTHATHPNSTMIPPLTVSHAELSTRVGIQAATLTGALMLGFLLIN